MKQSEAPPQGTHGVLIRMPVDLHQRLKTVAKQEDRPVNAQIVHLIRRYLEEN